MYSNNICLSFLLSFLLIKKIADASTSCGHQKPVMSRDGRIVNGVEAVYDQFPWAVSIQYMDPRRSNEYVHYCGGSIIEANVIVTAGHCSPKAFFKSQGISVTKVRIVAGCITWDMTDKDSADHCQSIEVVPSSFTDFPDYISGKTSGLIHDITIAKLPQSFRMTDSVTKICLPDPDTLFKGMATVAGWGKHYESQEAKSLFATSRVMRTADVNILPSKVCEVYPKDRYDPEFNICAGFRSGFRDSCQGDSGGPLMGKVRDQVFLIGIVSFGSGCAEESHPGVYVRVTAKMDWIQSVISKF